MGNILVKDDAGHSNSTFGIKVNMEALPLEVLEHIWSYLDFDTRQVCQYRLWSFQAGGTKLERFLPKDQHIQRKLLNFENWVGKF